MKTETHRQSETPQEIERKFQVRKLPDNLESFLSKSIKQGYVSIADDGTEVRVRQKGDKYYRTTKRGSGVVRPETEEEISQADFDKDWQMVGDRVIEKTRYEIPLTNGNLAEFDVYGGKLQGLMVVEVEFADENKANEFVAPDWFGEDVSNDPNYKNASLAVNGNPEAKAEQIPEYNLEQGVTVLVEKVREKMKEKEGPVIVLVAGGSASGKTSAVADKVHKAFGEDSIILSLDDYYRGGKYMEAMSEEGVDYNYDQPEVINLDLFSVHLEALKRGETIEKPIYNFSIGEADKSEMVPPRRVIVVEGLFALNEKVSHIGDVKAFVEVGTHGRLIRRILRDIESRGQNPDDILDYFGKVVEPMHEEYIEGTKEEADLIIHNEYNPNVEARGIKEVQIKFAGNIKPEVLRKLGAERIGNSTQVDTYYNPKDRDLGETGEYLRVREENGHNIVSYKGPKQEGNFRIRPKIDFEIDPKTTESLIKMYGGLVQIIKKERTLYQLNGVTFSLDKVVKVVDGNEVDLGDFVEIRSVDSSANDSLEKVIKLLGFNLVDGDKRAYSEM
ncbi:MAG: class IV adenylate cyclase [Candidatus Paceibacterota bacterium]